MTAFDPARAKELLAKALSWSPRSDGDAHMVHLLEEQLEAACAEVERLNAKVERLLKIAMEAEDGEEDAMKEREAHYWRAEEAESLLKTALEVGLLECIELRAWTDILEKDEQEPMRAALREAVGVMRRIENEGLDPMFGTTRCPCCTNDTCHADDCQLAAAIARAERVLGDTP